MAKERVERDEEDLVRLYLTDIGQYPLLTKDDEVRLAQEIAILADRMDVSEELDRFRSHITAFHGVLSDTAGEPVGKRLGFLLQEMLREANTTGSKAADAAKEAP